MRKFQTSLVAAALVLAPAGCGDTRPYSIEEVRRAFADAGIRLDPPDFSERGMKTDGVRIRATLWHDSDVEVDVYHDVDAYERVRGPLRRVGAGDVLGERNIVVIGPVRGSAPRVEAALERLR